MSLIDGKGNIRDWQQEYRDMMENKRSAAYNLFIEKMAYRSEEILYVKLDLYETNGVTCLQGTAATMFQFGDGGVNLHYYTLQYETSWVHSTAPGQCILEKEGIARLIELLAK